MSFLYEHTLRLAWLKGACHTLDVHFGDFRVVDDGFGLSFPMTHVGHLRDELVDILERVGVLWKGRGRVDAVVLVEEGRA